MSKVILGIIGFIIGCYGGASTLGDQHTAGKILCGFNFIMAGVNLTFALTATKKQKHERL